MKRCMIVDGSSVIRKVARRILSGFDMVVIEAGRGEEALAMCAAEMPEVIMVDNLLPDMGGVEFIQRVMALNPARKPHIVVCMTQMDIGALMRAKRAGAAGYVLKPFNRPQLLERFRQLKVAA